MRALAEVSAVLKPRLSMFGYILRITFSDARTVVLAAREHAGFVRDDNRAERELCIEVSCSVCTGAVQADSASGVPQPRLNMLH